MVSSLQARMGCGSPLCAKLCETIVSQFKDNVSQRKIAKNLVFDQPQFIILWKVSGSPGKSRCAKAKGGKRCWMCVTIQPSDCFVEKPSCRWTERLWKYVLWEKWTSGSLCQRWKRPSRLLSTKSAKNSLCDGMGVHQCPRHGWSAYMWRYHWLAYVRILVKVMMIFSRNSMSISAGQCQALFWMSYNSVAL